MKVKVGEKVYLQRYEVKHLVYNLKSFPDSVLQEIFTEDGDSFFFMNGSVDGFWFDCVFENPDSVKWLMQQDWIVDYNKYAKMPLTELEALLTNLRTEHTADIDNFNAKDEAYRKEHFKEECRKLDRAGYKISSLKNLVAARKGEVKFVFPEEFGHGAQ